jgi:hypothetical protein
MMVRTAIQKLGTFADGGAVIKNNLAQSPHALTQDAPIDDDSHVLGPDYHRVGIIEGSRPELATETTDLLRTRLRAAAGILGLAFSLFFGYRLLRGEVFEFADGATFYFHFAVCVVLVSSFGLLCRKCCIPLGVLRGYELLIFGLPAAYFLVNEVLVFGLMAQRGIFPNPTSVWMGTVFIYAMFIPNTWRRAAVITGVLCALPVVLMGYMWFRDPVFADLLSRSTSLVVEITIMMGVTFLSATYGTGARNEADHEISA